MRFPRNNMCVLIFVPAVAASLWITTRAAHAQAYSSEYIRLAGRLVAVETPTIASAPTINPSAVTLPGQTPGSAQFTITAAAGQDWTATLDSNTSTWDSNTSTWLQISGAPSPYNVLIGSGTQTVTLTLTASNPSSSSRSGTLMMTGSFATLTLGITQLSPPLGFYSITPCRVADTRAGQGKTGSFGPPNLYANAIRSFAIPSGSCNIPATAAAYSLNLTVSPPGPVTSLSAWAHGQPQPNTTILNSPGGTVIANAAIVSAGTSGGATGIDVLATNNTDLIIDINGYFNVPNGTETTFYPLNACRVADTRAGQGKSGAFGPPSLTTQAREFPLPSGGCGIPSSASAYSLNLTAVPQGHLDWLSAWPYGQGWPGVSTLNSPNGAVIANAAIVVAGSGGTGINVQPAQTTDLIIDVDGYFGAPSSGLHYYPITACSCGRYTCRTRKDRGLRSAKSGRSTGDSRFSDPIRRVWCAGERASLRSEHDGQSAGLAARLFISVARRPRLAWRIHFELFERLGHSQHGTRGCGHEWQHYS